MSESRPPFALSEQERAKIAAVDVRVAKGGAEDVLSLLRMLVEPSWAVRRAVVAGLAALGDAALPGLAQALRTERDSETRVAAAVDAFSASSGKADQAALLLTADPNPAIAADGAQILGRRRVVSALPALEALIHGPDDNVAVAAIEALGRIGGARALDSLVAAAQGSSFFRVFPAIDVLGRTQDPRAVAPLAALLSNPLYALEAARALSRTGERAAVAPLSQLLSSRSGANLRIGAVALAELYEQAELRYGTAASIVEALRPLAQSSALAERLARGLPDADSAEQIAFCVVLGALANEAAIGALARLVESPPPLGEAASKALNRLGRDAQAELLHVIRQGGTQQRLAILPFLSSTDARELVVDCLRDDDSNVRVLACAALAKFGDPSVVGALFERLEDPDAEVAQAALSAIQALGGPMTERLATALARSPVANLRRSALRILAYFGFPAALDVFIDVMNDEDARLRELALSGIALIEGDRATKTLLAASASASARTRAVAAKALGQRDADSRVIGALMDALRDADPWVRYYSCQSLGKLEWNDAAPRIEELLRDAAGQVRVSAIEALSHLGGDRARRALLNAATSDDGDLSRAALIGLGIVPHPDALPTLLSASSAAEPTTRLMALSALSKFDSPKVLEALIRTLGDADPSVRNAAWGFLATRSGADVTAALVEQLRKGKNVERAVTALSSPIRGRVSDIVSNLREPQEATARGLVSALARTGTEEATAALVAAMTRENPVVRRLVAPVLGALGTRESTDALRRAETEDPDPEVRRICALLRSS